jgi:DNA-binding NarL/FixJ family response regulator
MSAPIRIRVADDSQCMRRAISMMLAAEPTVTVCGEVGTYSELLKKIGELHPRVVLTSDEITF